MPDLDLVEIDNCRRYFSLILRVVPTMSVLSNLAWISSYGMSSMENFILNFLGPVILFLLGSVLKNSNGFGLLTKRILIFSSAELFLIYLKWVEYASYEHKMALCMTATILMVNFQLRWINNSYLVVVVAAKHVLEWYYIDFIIKKIDAPFDIYGIVSAFGFIVVSIVNFHIRMSKLKQLIKDRKRIQDNKSIFEHVFNIMTNGMIILGKDKQILHSNQSIQVFLECEPHEILEHLSIIHYKARRRLIQTPEATKSVLEDIYYCLSLDLDVKKCLGTVSIRDLSVDISVSHCEFLSENYLIVLFTDVTPILALESVEIENSCKTMLLRYIPHELQTPVVGLVGCIETVLADLATTSLESIEESMKVMDVSVKLLLLLIRNINDYVKMLTDSFTVEKTHISLVDLIRNVRELFIQQTTYQKLNFHVRVDPTLPESIYTDSRRLTQVLVSLLSNSLKYTFTGHIELIVYCTRVNKIKFSIVDTGIGISSERLDRIQTQIASPSTDSSVIGLDIANSIINHLGGTQLKLKSGPNSRTKASFSIPSELPDPSSSNSEDSFDRVPEEQNSLSRIRLPTATIAKISQVVMIVDDNDFNRQVLSKILTSNKISCIECKDGHQAITHIHDYDSSCKPIKVVIMDIDMPIVNGWEATERILALYNSQKIKSKPLIIGYSAFNSPEDIERSYKAGMISYINKPATAEYMVSTVMSLLAS